MRIHMWVIFIVVIYSISGCHKAQIDLDPVVKKQASTVPEAPMPLSVEIDGADRYATYGAKIPLSITIRNNSPRAIWINENGLPWTSFHSLKAHVDSPFLAASNPIADPGRSKWKKLEPEERLRGSIDLSGWLYSPAHPPKAKRVEVRVGMSVTVSETSPDQLKWSTFNFDLGRLTIEVPPAGANN